MVFDFVMHIVLNVALPSFDTYSDVTLAYKTLTFSLGESLLLAGCRVCQGKDEAEIYKLKNKPCLQCLTSGAQRGNDDCGSSYEVLNKLYDLERQDTCENEHFSLALNFNLTTESNVLTNEKCDYWKDLCCVENRKRTNASRFINPLDKSFFAFPTSYMDHDYNKMIYLTYLLSGKLSLQYCRTVFSRYFTTTIETFYNYVNKNVTAMYSPIKAEIYLKFTISGNGKISLENGYTNEDGCGILPKRKNDYHIDSITSKNDGICGLDSCLLHLQSLRRLSNISGLDDWKYKTF